MGSKQSHCYKCQKNILAQKDDAKIGCFAHLVHAFFTLCTGFLWGIIWIIHANYNNGKFRCPICGGVVK